MQLYKDQILNHEKQSGKNLDFRRLYNFYALHGGEGVSNSQKDMCHALVLSDHMQWGCNPMRWKEDILIVRTLYSGLSDEIKRKKVTISYVDPDPRYPLPDDFTWDFKMVDKEVDLNEMVNALLQKVEKNEDASQPQFSLLRGAVSVDSPCWHFGKVAETVEALLNSLQSMKGGETWRRS